MHLGIPSGDFDDAYHNSTGFLLWRNFWAKLRFGAFELLGGYQRFSRADGNAGCLFVYPITVNIVVRAPDALFRPYASIGGGAYGWEARERVPGEDTELVDSDWHLGWTAGIGIEYYLRTRVAFDVGLRFHSTAGPGSSGGISKDRLRFLTLWIGHYLRF
jgi:opacity protein-like surface antigen